MANLLGTITVNVCVGILFFLIFCWMRRRWFDFFSWKTQQNELWSHKPNRGFFSWILSTIRYKDDLLINHPGGMDGLLFVRFLKYCNRFFLFVSILSLAVILPLNRMGDMDGDLNLSGIELYTMANIKPDSNIMWVHLSLCVIFVFATWFLQYQLYKDYLAVAFLLGKEDNLTSRTVMCHSLPNEVKTDEQLMNLFIAQFGHRVTDAMVAKDSSHLHPLADEREKILKKWKIAKREQAECSTRPTTRIKKRLIDSEFPQNNIGEVVDAIDYYEKTIRQIDWLLVSYINQMRLQPKKHAPVFSKKHALKPKDKLTTAAEQERVRKMNERQVGPIKLTETSLHQQMIKDAIHEMRQNETLGDRGGGDETMPSDNEGETSQILKLHAARVPEVSGPNPIVEGTSVNEIAHAKHSEDLEIESHDSDKQEDSPLPSPEVAAEPNQSRKSKKLKKSDPESRSTSPESTNESKPKKTRAKRTKSVVSDSSIDANEGELREIQTTQAQTNTKQQQQQSSKKKRLSKTQHNIKDSNSSEIEKEIKTSKHLVEPNPEEGGVLDAFHTHSGEIVHSKEVARELDLPNKNFLNLQVDISTSSVIPGRIGFVSFDSLTAAIVAAHAIQLPNPFVLETRRAPHASDVAWRWIGKSRRELWIRRIIVGCVLVVLFVAVAAAVAGISTITSVSSFAATSGFARAIADSGWLAESIIQGLFPSTLVMLLMAVIPLILFPIINQLAMVRNSDVNRGAAGIFYVFIVFNIFLVLTFGGGFWNVVGQSLNSEANIINLLAAALPNQSVFFTNYVVSLATFSIGIASWKPIFFIKSRIKASKAKTEREKKAANNPPPILYKIIFGYVLMVFTIGLVFSVMSPFIAPYCMLYFFNAYILYKYQLVYMTMPEFVGFPLTPFSQNGITIGLCMFLIIMGGLFGVKRFAEGAVVCGIFTFFTIVYRTYYLRLRFGRAAHTLPLQLCPPTIKKDRLERHRLDDVHALYTDPAAVVPRSIDEEKTALEQTCLQEIRKSRRRSFLGNACLPRRKSGTNLPEETDMKEMKTPTSIIQTQTRELSDSKTTNTNSPPKNSQITVEGKPIVAENNNNNSIAQAQHFEESKKQTQTKPQTETHQQQQHHHQNHHHPSSHSKKKTPPQQRKVGDTD